MRSFRFFHIIIQFMASQLFKLRMVLLTNGFIIIRKDIF